MTIKRTTTRKKRAGRNQSPYMRKLREMDTSDMTTEEISEIIGLNVATTRTYLWKLGRTANNGGFKPSRQTRDWSAHKEALRQMDTSNMTSEQVAERLGLSIEDARSALASIGRTTRNGGYKRSEKNYRVHPTKQKLMALDTRHMRLEEIADHLGVTPERAQYLLKSLRRTTRNGGYLGARSDPERETLKARLRALDTSNMRLPEIAQRLGVEHAYAGELLRSIGRTLSNGGYKSTRNPALAAARRELRALDTSDMTVHDIAKRLGLDPKRTANLLRDLGRTVSNGGYKRAPRPGDHAQLKERLRRMNTSELTIDQIAKRLKVDTRRARNLLTSIGRTVTNGGVKAVRPHLHPTPPQHLSAEERLKQLDATANRTQGRPLSAARKELKQLDTSDMTLEQVAQRLNTDPKRAAYLLHSIKRTPDNGGYKSAHQPQP